MKLLYIGLVCRILAFSLAKPLPDDEAEPVKDESTVNGRVLYDQRQSGKYNIHIIIKDVAIIEMDQNEIVENNDDGDYYYDEEDLTVKPLALNLNTNKPTATISTTEAVTTTIRSIENDISSLALDKNIAEDDAFGNHKDRITNCSVLNKNKIEPIYTTSEPIIRDITEKLQARDAEVIDDGEMKNAKVYKIKLPPKGNKRLCRSNQFRDGSGACRSKKSPVSSRQSSGSIL
uniref:Uncharacterized protein n=1 Tax=Glossina brevipalpis TaxID=37001 RepID=A0A1A9WUU9_9MUSC